MALHVDSLEYSLATGRLAAATSSLTGASWNGALVLIDEEGKITKTIRIGEGANDVAWLGPKESELLLCSCDDGTLQIWNVSQKGREECVRYLVEHDDIATSVSAHHTDRDSFLSASWDMTIKLWSTSNNPTTFKGHTNFVWDVEWNAKSADTFISASQDRTVKLWDRRKQGFTQVFRADLPVFTASWDPNSEHIFAYGDAGGSIFIHDARNSQESLFAYRGHTAGVRKVKFSPSAEHTLLASAADDTFASVWDWKAMTSVYSHKHEDFVRGLAWHPTKPKNFVSGGWDKCVLFHTLQ